MTPDDDVAIESFEFDQRNLQHLLRHGLDDNLIWDVWAGEPRVFTNRPGRSATHLMVGPDGLGQCWTVAILLVDDSRKLWRPITGWPSTGKEREACQASD